MIPRNPHYSPKSKRTLGLGRVAPRRKFARDLDLDAKRYSHHVTDKRKRARAISVNTAAAIVNSTRGTSAEERQQRLRQREWARLGGTPEERQADATS